MNDEVLNLLENLLPYSRNFNFELNNLYKRKQSEQLNYILPFISRLVDCEFTYDDKNEIFNRYKMYVNNNLYFMPMIEKLFKLKDDRDMILKIVESKEDNYDLYMKTLSNLYKHGENIDYMVNNVLKYMN